MRYFHGYDWDSGSDIMIEKSQPNFSDGSFKYIDLGEGKSRRVHLVDFRKHKVGLAMRVADNDSGEERILELIA